MSLTTSILTLAIMTSTATQNPPPKLQREFRGVWVATVANIDWPSKPGLPTQQQQAELIKIMDRAASLNLNAIILQVRPSTDALYESPHEPWADYLTGQQGKAPNPKWDPLAFAVEAAHKRGMELHCWFNPYRASHPSQKSALASRHISRTNPRLVRNYGRYMWLDPGEPEVQKHSLEVMMDVVRRYDIDGVHIDDYFYPYKEKGPDGKLMDFPDNASWAKYVASGGKLKRDDWRRKNVDDFIERLYKDIKAEKKWVKFGISPFGIYRPGIPAGIQAGVDQYGDLYADAKKWLVEGWVDYYTPQLYWPIKQIPQSYPILLDWWMDQNVKGRHMWPGNFTSRTNPSDGNWPAKEVLDQISVTRKQGAGGNVHFSMKALMNDWNAVSSGLVKGPYANKALVPASKWLDPTAPKAPTVNVAKTNDNQGWRVSWVPSGDEDVRFFGVMSELGGKWTTVNVTSDRELIVRPRAGIAPSRIAIFAIDRAGNESAPSYALIGG